MSIPKPDDSFVFVSVDPVNLGPKVPDMKVEPRPPEMKSMHVVSNVRNRYARTVVTSKYANPDTSAQQATFSIVLPDTAFIAGFIMEIKGKKYEAYVKEKEEAKQEYQQAVSSGRAAAHVAVSARDSNKFTVSVNVEPQSDVTFILTYEELLVRKHSKYEMVVNLHPGQILDDLGVDIHINETRPIINVETPDIRSGNEISNAVTKNNYATIKRDTEEIVHVSFHPTVEQQKEMTKTFSHGISGQFVVEYDVERDPLGGEVLVNDGYFVHFFAPTELKPIPKNVVFVLDVSGSMQGRKIEQLKEAMRVILSELNPDDYFNIIKFENNVHILYNNNTLQEVANSSLPATAENINKAQRVVGSMQASGGTNISDALITALTVTSKGISVPGKNTKIQPIIVFLTDGQANVGESNPDKIIDIVLKQNDSENKSAIFTLAFGNDANKEFLKELAVKNSGFLRNIYEAADASLQLQDFYKQISSPLLTNVNFKYSEDVKEVTKHKFDILFNGSEFVVTGKVDKVVDGFVVVEGSTLCGTDNFRPTIIPICSTREEKEKFGDLERLWAYMTIKQLLDKKYEKKNQNDDSTSSETPEKQALKLALKYSFVTQVTSLVVVKPDDDLQWGSVRVASSHSLLPAQKYGKSIDFSFGKPQAASAVCLSGIASRASVATLFGKQVSGFPTGQFGRSSNTQSLSFGAGLPGPPPPPPPFGKPAAPAVCRSGIASRPSVATTFGKQVSGFPTGQFGRSSNIQPFNFGPGAPPPASTSFNFGTNSNLFGSTNAKPPGAPSGCNSNYESFGFAGVQSGAITFAQSAFAASPNSSQNLWNNTFNADTVLKNLVSQPPELKRMHVVSNVVNCYARTQMTSKYANQESRALQTAFSIVLPDTAFITGFVMEMKGIKYEANMGEKEQSKKEYQEAVTQGLAAAHVTASTDNSNKFTVFVNIEPNSEVTFILTYEQLLVQKNSKYEIVLNLHPGRILQNLEVDVKIIDTKPITFIKTPVFKSKNQMMEIQHTIFSKDQDGSINICFKPTVEQQKEIINILKESDENKGISGQFVVEFNAEMDSEDTVTINNVPDAVPVTDLIVIKLN